MSAPEEEKTPTPETDKFYGCPSPESGKQWQTRGTIAELEFARTLERQLRLHSASRERMENALRITPIIEANDEQARADWEDGEGAECVTASGIWHAAIAYERARLRSALSAASQEGEKP